MRRFGVFSCIVPVALGHSFAFSTSEESLEQLREDNRRAQIDEFVEKREKTERFGAAGIVTKDNAQTKVRVQIAAGLAQ